MPTYDYVCEACGKELELFQSMKEAPKRKCPACGKPKLKRRIGSGAAIIFKGSGFYQTDYRSDSYKKGAEADKSSAGESTPAKPDEAAKKAEKPDKAEKAEKKKPKAEPAD